MGSDRKLEIDLSEAMAGDIDRAVASGDYQSADDVVAEALQAWKRQRDAEIGRLRELWRVGIESGLAQPVPDDWVEQIVARGKARLAAQRAQDDAA